MNPSIKLRGAPSGPTLAPSTPGYVLTVQADGLSVKPELGGQANVIGTVMTVPALSAAFADVTVSPGAGSPIPGDVFAVLMGTGSGSPRLANVAAVAAWSPQAGQVTVRFFGTTAGGVQLITLVKVSSAAP